MHHLRFHDNLGDTNELACRLPQRRTDTSELLQQTFRQRNTVAFDSMHVYDTVQHL